MVRMTRSNHRPEARPSPLRRVRAHDGARQLIAFADWLDERLGQVRRTATTVLLLDLADRRGERLVAEHIGYPARKIAALRVALRALRPATAAAP